jgi:outer membrane murein-binding lipoprotein Lpp
MKVRMLLGGLLVGGLLLAGGGSARAEETDQERLERLEDRVGELEAAQDAKDSATRAVISQALSDLGSNINNVVAFGGTFEVLGGWTEDLDRTDESLVRLNTAELDFEISPSPWLLGSLIIQYDDGLDRAFTTADGEEASVDRVNIDTAFLRVGNPELFPPYAKLGRVIVPFGISTGDPVADVLTIEDPLTVEVFETLRDAVQLGVEFPTPPIGPETPIPTPPKARPLVISPAVEKLARWLGYDPPPAPPPRQTYISPPKPVPPFVAAVYTYDGDTHRTLGAEGKWNPTKHVGATVGYRNRGACAVPFCIPWSFQVDVDWSNSIFESNFLRDEYKVFLDDIAFEPGMAFHTRASLGPVALVAEWNGALEHTTFRDDAGVRQRISPNAWQVSVAYQLDWNRWIEVVGLQGTYITAGYSESNDLAGVLRDIGGELVRVGFVPERRFLVGAGEWVLPNMRISVEYSRFWDYKKDRGGTGRAADGVLALLTFEW